MDESSGLTIEELAERGGVPVRTVRFYIAERLLPRPEGRGKGVSYGEEHLLRLRLVRLLVERRVPLAEVRTRLEGLGLDEVRSLLAQEEQRTQQVTEAPSPRAYISALLERARVEPAVGLAASSPPPPPPPAFGTPPPPALGGVTPPEPTVPAEPAAPPTPAAGAPAAWQRIELAPGVELHVRSDAADRERRLVDRILNLAGQAGRRWGWLPFGGHRSGGRDHVAE